TDRPVVGDWNGDGNDTVGVFRNGAYYLRNSNSSGAADLAFGYGDPGDQPLSGDWNGDGKDTVGIWRNGALYLTHRNATGVADYVFGYGDPGDAAIIGDWDHNGTDELGVVRASYASAVRGLLGERHAELVELFDHDAVAALARD